MKVLVTGANGQLGMSLRRVIPGPAVFTDIAELDITDLSAVRALVAEEGIDCIVNCAGYTNVEKAEDEPLQAEALNAGAVENLAVAMKEAGGLLVHISTDYVFGGAPCASPISEEQRPAPLNAYGRSKLHGEEAILRSGVRYIILRTAWLYSEYGNNFVKTMLRLTAERPALKVVEDQVGNPTYAGDLAGVIVRLLKNPSAVQEGIYHYTGEGECSWYEFAKAIAAYAGHTACNIQPCSTAEYPLKARRPSYSALDKGKIVRMLGIEIPHWRSSLQGCLSRMVTG